MKTTQAQVRNAAAALGLTITYAVGPRNRRLYIITAPDGTTVTATGARAALDLLALLAATKTAQEPAQ